tara:strand:- start:953 stop:1567 length:615 start_codon:yes stop_codon:yes gene_type:complete
MSKEFKRLPSVLPLPRKRRSVVGFLVLIAIVAGVVYFWDDIKNFFIKDVIPEVEGPKKEVYNVSKNIYNYEGAKRVCKSLSANIASHDQVVQAYNDGAEWCNYGWSQGQNALFPIQKATWEELQTQPKRFRNECGQTYGVNGGFFENSNLRFGANCYGIKPKGEVADDYQISPHEIPDSPLLRDEDIDKLGIIPFNHSRWSKYN